ncbi:MAG: DUF4145 domain-containing protein [gamma proteobacterium endosymbiont of Lamellibrachia anaximandri]|nr:DUF4145 domain-containing protein [gamma proteobacterium endosymbiont of Lamellibrachia anaximandri]
MDECAANKANQHGQPKAAPLVPRSASFVFRLFATLCVKEIEMSEIKKIHCNTCNHETNHVLLATHDKDYHEVEEHQGQKHLLWYENYVYGFWVCRGCDTALLEEKYTCSGMYDNNGDEVYSYTHLPERKNKAPRVAKKYVHINKKLNSAYLEVIKAHNQGLKIVSAIGVRALLEGICVEEGIDDKAAYGLSGKIKKLQSVSNIPESIIDGLNGLKFIGDDAAHRLNESNKRTILLSIDLLEALLTHLYEAKFDLQKKADLVKKAHNE